MKIPFFKKKITLSQLIADSIFNSMNFYDSNAEKLIDLSDELKVLDNDDKKELREFGYALVIGDLYVSCVINFNEKISNEELGKAFGFLYPKFLIDVKHLNETEVERKMDILLKLLASLEANGSENNTEDGLKFLLCSNFSKLYSGDNLKDKKVEGKNFAAFKLAKAIVKADLVSTLLEDFRVIIK